tara:strand:+ start:1143 stop:2069 length:927 start_codon:yes stop_codon:yes gene_type:complete
MKNSIKVGYDSKTNLYTFKTPGDYSAKNVCVNGNPITDPLRGQKVGELMTMNEKPETITYETSQRTLIGYDCIETNTTVSVKSYLEMKALIEITREYDDSDDGDGYTYDSIEDEVVATRFFRNYKAIYENVDTVHNMDIEFISYPVSEYSNIVPLYSIDAKNVFETKCKYTPNNIDTFKDLCKARGIDISRIDIPTHSGLRYATIDKKYISGMEAFERSLNREIIASYDECITTMNSAKSKLTELLNFHFAKQSQNVLDESTVGSLLTQLQNLQTSVNKLDVKVKDETSQRSVSQRINELIRVYKELA